MNYRSEWNEKNELKCLIIFKKLESQNFKRGLQAKYVKEMAKETNLTEGNISAKICNYKSVAGINRKSNASRNTIKIHRKYKESSIEELEMEVNKIELQEKRVKTNCHEVVCIIDRSGSMDRIKSDTIGGFNSFVKSQKEFDNKTNLSLILFNDKYQIVYESKDIKEVTVLNETTYTPCGLTSMLDAIGTTIDRMNERFLKIPGGETPKKVIVAILTDGYENSSIEYNYEQIAKKIQLQQATYNWDFIFLAANQDAVVAAEKISIKSEDAINFEANEEGISIAFSEMSEKVLLKRSF